MCNYNVMYLPCVYGGIVVEHVQRVLVLQRVQPGGRGRQHGPPRHLAAWGFALNME